MMLCQSTRFTVTYAELGNLVFVVVALARLALPQARLQISDASLIKTKKKMKKKKPKEEKEKNKKQKKKKQRRSRSKRMSGRTIYSNLFYFFRLVFVPTSNSCSSAFLSFLALESSVSRSWMS